MKKKIIIKNIIDKMRIKSLNLKKLQTLNCNIYV